MRITVVICTHDRAELLARTVTYLNQVRRPLEMAIELMVIANACSDGTAAWLAEYQRAGVDGRLKLRWIAEPTPGKSHALNRAISMLDTGLAAFVDDDHRVDAGYFEALAHAVAHYPEATMFCGRILPDWDGREPTWVHDRGRYRIYPLPVPWFELGQQPIPVTPQTSIPGGGNLVVRCEVFRRIGGFSPDLGPRGHDLGGSEDTDFVLRALAAGERIQYLPGLTQFHYVDPERLTLSYILKKAYQRNRFITRAKHGGDKGVPRYLWRKVATYSVQVLTALRWARMRFYLVRLAGSLGELRGNLEGPATAEAESALPAPAVLALLIPWAALPAADPARVLSVTVMVAALLAAALLVKSILDFTRSGPAIPDDVLHHYRLYNNYVVVRLGLWTFVISGLLVGAGTAAYGGYTYLNGVPFNDAWAGVAGATSFVLIAGLQFCDRLLYRPSAIAVSFQYRLSRFYPLWQRLSPGRLALLRWLLFAGGAGIYVGCLLRSAVDGELGRLSAFLVSLVAILGLLAWVQWEPPIRAPRAARRTDANVRPNIIMIGADTLRADRLSSNGYYRTLTPTIDQLAALGGVFSECYVPLARTAPSLASLLTGTWPHQHGVRDNYVPDDETRLPVPALPQLLREQGYRTVAIADWSGADLDKLGFGFEDVETPPDQWNLKYYLRQGPMDLRLFVSLFTHNRFGRTCLPELFYLAGVPLTRYLGDRTLHRCAELMQGGRPFLLNVFMGTTHVPYGSEYPYYLRFTDRYYRGESKFIMHKFADPMEIIEMQEAERSRFEVPQILNLYDSCVARFDDELARILTHLDQWGLLQESIIVVYSDHGTDFFENHTWGQGNTVMGTDPSARVPLAIVDPRRPAAGVVRDPVRSIDLTPTLLDLLGLNVPTSVDGVSLVPYLDGRDDAPALAAYQETGVWLGRVPGMHPQHLTYPNLLELLEVRDRNTGTLAIKKCYEDVIIEAKDRMIRTRRWKLVYLPLVDGALYRLFDVQADPECRNDVADAHPEVFAELKAQLVAWMCEDGGREWRDEHLVRRAPQTTPMSEAIHA